MSAYADGSYAPSECELACQDAEMHVAGCPVLWVCACNYQNVGPICTHCGHS